MKKAILFRPRIKNYPRPRLDNSNFDAIVEVWKKFYPQSVCDEKSDYEDFIENAIQLYTYFILVPDDVYALNPSNNKYCNVHGGMLEKDAADVYIQAGMAVPHYKVGVDSEKLIPSKSDIIHGKEYYKIRSFLGNADRRISIGSFSEGEMHYQRQLKNQIPGNYCVKMCAQKYMPLAKIRVDEGEICYEDPRMEEALGLASCHLEGDEYGVMIQDKIQMRYEYRVVIVNQQPVSGAGCVEAFTPLNREKVDTIFDPKMECIRNQGKIVTAPVLASEYLLKAKSICAEIREELPEFKNYILDFAINEDSGEMCIVEINPFENYGLYANDFMLIAKALLK